MRALAIAGAVAALVLCSQPSEAQAPRAEAARARLTVAPEGNRARYRVREQLAGVDFPNDAVGETTAVSGAIVLDAAGRIDSTASRIVVEVGSLTSDRDRRDRYVRMRTLQADSFPTVVLVPTAARGLPAALPASGRLAFRLDGRLTVRGVTRPTTWDVTAEVAGGVITGTATTRFTFADVELAKPRVASVLTVDDAITLEYDFRLVLGPGGG